MLHNMPSVQSPSKISFKHSHLQSHQAFPSAGNQNIFLQKENVFTCQLVKEEHDVQNLNNLCTLNQQNKYGIIHQ